MRIDESSALPSGAATGLAIDLQKASPVVEKMMEEAKDFSLEAVRAQNVERVKDDAEIRALSDQLDANNPDTIVKFGEGTAIAASKTADMILAQSMDSATDKDCGVMMANLLKIMKSVDIEEVAKTPKKGIFGNFMEKLQKSIDTICSKYNTIGAQLDEVYTALLGYSNQILDDNMALKQMQEEAIFRYGEITKYIAALDMAGQELDEYIAGFKPAPEDMAGQARLQALGKVSNLLKQRTMDMRMLENAAMQDIPTINSMVYDNAVMYLRIQSAFILTLPEFKRNLAMAVMQKREILRRCSTDALDEYTNTLRKKVASQSAALAIQSERQMGETVLKIDTLEDTAKSIIAAAAECKKINEENVKKRADQLKRLEAIRSQYGSTFGGVVQGQLPQ